jgi:DNA-directed RNA polymerase sigma subunit (sigma70/sigma32)
VTIKSRDELEFLASSFSEVSESTEQTLFIKQLIEEWRRKNKRRLGCDYARVDRYLKVFLAINLEGKSFKEAGKEIGVGSMRARQIDAVIARDMRKIMNKFKIRNFTEAM